MAANRTYEEVLKFVIKAGGDEELVALVREMTELGDAGEEAKLKLSGLLEDLGNAKGLERTAAKFRATGAEVIALNQRYEQQKAKAVELAAAMAEVENPTARQERAFARARDALEKVGAELTETKARWAEQRSELERSGVAAGSYAAQQAKIAERQEAAAAALRDYTRETIAARTAQQAQAARIAEGEEAFRKQATASRTSAEALRAWRARAAEAADQAGDTGNAVGGLRGIYEQLKGVLAGAAAALGVAGAADGIRNLLGVASAAENARRSLSQLFGSQEAGNRAFEALHDIARRNGLAFQDVVDQAVKLKSFGLDPLNGSMQALIDQNAAVGGSNEELERKVLALGQAWAKEKLQGEEIMQLIEAGVPVWGLLEKATGKNVAQLQQLAQAGKLGRDVIQKLIGEIANANTGAAQEGLSGLSGLVSQLTSRWQDFALKVADAGVADYFREQARVLLGSTGDMDDMARRLGAAIVSTVESIRKFGAELLAIAKPVADVGLAVARHADAVVLLGKVYLATKLTQVAANFASVATQTRAAAAATTELTAAEAARGAGVGKLGALAAKVPGVLKMTFLAIGLDVLLGGIDKLNEGLEARREAIQANEGIERAQRDLQVEQLSLGKQLQQLYASYAQTAIASADELRAKTQAQTQDYAFALQQAREYYAGVIRDARASGNAQREAAAHEKWDELGKAIDGARQHLVELQATAVSAPQAAANAAVEKFDQLIAKGKSARDAINNIFNGIDFTSANGLKQVGAVIEQIQARGTAASKALRSELIEALRTLSADELPKLEASAIQAFGRGSAEAKAMADAVAGIRADKLGVDLDGIRTGFTKAGKEATSLFDQVVGDVSKLSATAIEKSRAIGTAFDNAFRQASTSKELEALRASLQRALSEGSIGFADFQTRIAEVNGKLAELAGTGQSVGEGVKAGADQAASSLNTVAQAAEQVADRAEDAAAAAERSGDSMREASGDAQGFGLVMGDVSDQFTKAALGANRFVNSIATERFANQLNAVTNEYRRQQGMLNDMQQAIDRQIASFDPLTRRVEQLRTQYGYLGDAQLRGLAEKEKQLNDLQQRQTEEAQRAMEQATRQQTSAQAAGPARAVGAAAPVATAGSLPSFGTIRVELPDGTAGQIVTDANGAQIVRQLIDQLTRSRANGPRKF